jgi:hypothetical protein
MDFSRVGRGLARALRPKQAQELHCSTLSNPWGTRVSNSTASPPCSTQVVFAQHVLHAQAQQ